MNPEPIAIHVGEAPEIQAFLAERIYEFNSKAIGCFDGESFAATRRDVSGTIHAGICGHTWAGCGYVSYLWVEASQRGRGLGTALLVAAEEHARRKGCRIMLVATHSFQAPLFYEQMGYVLQAAVRDHPIGHRSLVLAKHLHPGDPDASLKVTALRTQPMPG
jgi:GNAT superfamily N-acetyltransferase